jgi:alpha-methylacyl-CoA racemase
MGVLDGLRVIEMAGIGPAPFCGMLLADMGADVLRIERPAAAEQGVRLPDRFDLLQRNKRSVALDLKSASGRAALHELLDKAEVLIEGFRPGVMEKLGLGPGECLARNPRLVYGRMTGWGQEGPLAQVAGHDLNYIGLAGVLHEIGAAGGPPVIPLNVVGDFGGGALYLALGVLAGVLEARRSGLGQVVDAAIVDGVASLMTLELALRAAGAAAVATPDLDPGLAAPRGAGGRGRGRLNGGAPFYNVYETLDGRYLSVAPLEDRFYAELLQRLGAQAADLPPRADAAAWPALHERLARILRTRTQAQWCELFADSDACVAPVLDLDESMAHPHNAARRTFVQHGGVAQPQPAPRFSRTPSALRNPPPQAGADTAQALLDWGLAPQRVAELERARQGRCGSASD